MKEWMSRRDAPLLPATRPNSKLRRYADQSTWTRTFPSELVHVITVWMFTKSLSLCSYLVFAYLPYQLRADVELLYLSQTEVCNY